jgi:hypothetical protein
MHKPVQRRFKRFDRVLVPFDPRDVVLAARQATACGRCNAIETAPVQVEHPVGPISP